jgi:predicted DNA binding CopG/RHH family protein
MDKLDKYEKDILESYENDEWVPVKDSKDIKRRFAEYAKNTFKKNKRINIRISEKDLADLKVKSLEEGMPYQTLISSILHKYISGKLVDS